jgi:hypothetical protein
MRAREFCADASGELSALQERNRELEAQVRVRARACVLCVGGRGRA